MFFEFDESDITPEAASVLNSAVTAYGDCGMASVMLAGHTDTVRVSDAYNMALAGRRNDSVQALSDGSRNSSGAHFQPKRSVKVICVCPLPMACVNCKIAALKSCMGPDPACSLDAINEVNRGRRSDPPALFLALQKIFVVPTGLRSALR